MRKLLLTLMISLACAGAAAGAGLGTPQLLPGMTHAISLTATSWASNSSNNRAGNAPALDASAVTITAAPAAAAVSGTAGVTGTAAALAPSGVTVSAAPVDEGQESYDSLTTTADFNYRPAYVESRYHKNELYQDIAVSAVEAVPFGFLLTFMGIFVAEAAGQHTIQPKLKTLKDYTPIYAVSIGALAVLNVTINTLFFYDYKKENSHAKKTEKK
jgi:hypothetical protein